MRFIQKILFTFAIVVGLSVAVSAQKGDPKKPPPKGTPPVVTPQPKPPPRENPPPDKPKKPVMIALAVETSRSSEMA